jgi:hypothetical protein
MACPNPPGSPRPRTGGAICVAGEERKNGRPAGGRTLPRSTWFPSLSHKSPCCPAGRRCSLGLRPTSEDADWQSNWHALTCAAYTVLQFLRPADNARGTCSACAGWRSRKMCSAGGVWRHEILAFGRPGASTPLPGGADCLGVQRGGRLSGKHDAPSCSPDSESGKQDSGRRPRLARSGGSVAGDDCQSNRGHGAYGAGRSGFVGTCRPSANR